MPRHHPADRQSGERSFRGGRRRSKRKYQVVRQLSNLGYSERRGCAVVGLDRSTYYDIKFRKPTDKEIRRLLLTDLIADILARSRGTYGRLRIRATRGNIAPSPHPASSVL